jgi:hypothetical protein
MRRFVLPLTLAALALLSAGPASAADPADPSPFTVFVDARRGSDGHNCGTIANPCKTFQFAVDRVAAGGKVIAEESGEYGALSITKAVTVEAAAGVKALIATTSSTGIDIHAGDTDTVTVRGLTLVSQHSLPLSVQGIHFVGGHALRVEGCVIDGYAFGILAVTPTPALLFVSDTIFRSCFIGSNFGSASTMMRGTFDRCRFEAGVSGFLLQQNGIGVVKDSVFTGMQAAGVGASAGPSGSSVELNLENCLIAHNEIGISSSGRNGGSTTVRISNCTVADNDTGVEASQGGVVLSRGNNTIEGNVTDVSGTLGAYSAR